MIVIIYTSLMFFIFSIVAYYESGGDVQAMAEIVAWIATGAFIASILWYVSQITINEKNRKEDLARHEKERAEDKAEREQVRATDLLRYATERAENKEWRNLLERRRIEERQELLALMKEIADMRFRGK